MIELNRRFVECDEDENSDPDLVARLVSLIEASKASLRYS